jgi:hypothetical protein
MANREPSSPYSSRIAFYHEGDKVQKIHLGDSRKLSQTDAMQKARKMKAEALGRSHSE